MKITLFGMGYVGVVSAACLSRDGHHVTGVDPNESKIDDLQQGRAPISEPAVAELIESAHGAGRLLATNNPAIGLDGCEMVWVCVGTPSRADGGVDLHGVETAARQIGEYLRTTSNPPLVVLRSTVPPGTTRDKFLPMLQQAGGATSETAVVFHPEFLREGAAISDFDDPPRIVVGESIPGAADKLLAIYGKLSAPRFRLSLEEAEFVKYADNLFHAVKITFANEAGALARSMGIDARRAAEILCADTKLNISPRYLRPGFAFGGSCLPKDLRAILHEAAVRSVAVPMLAGLSDSNGRQIDALVARVLAHRPRSVGMIGLAFKPGTDDLRESPFVTVAKRLLGEGLTIRIYDSGVHPERLVGRNREMASAALGHLERLLVPRAADAGSCDLVLINHPSVDAATVGQWLRRGTRVIDLVGVSGVERGTNGYEGIAW